jgi:phosphatidylglycerophosphate synthase
MLPAGELLTAANGLTFARLALAPVLVTCVLAGAPLVGSLVFALAVATDVADGRLARRRAEATPFGGVLDHAVDAAFVTAGTAALAAQGALPAPLAPLIALAFLQYALDSRVGNRGNHGDVPRVETSAAAGTAPAAPRGGLLGSALGRWNGIAYYVAVAVPLVRDALALGWPGPALVRALGWGLVATTALSMLDRSRRLRARMRPR